MNATTPFQISEFPNPSGNLVFRVSGWLDGKCVRKNFKTRAEAEAERQVLEVQRAQGDTGIRTAVTRLAEEQISEAEALFARVQGLPRSLTFYVDYALANYREPQTQKALSDAIALYTAAKYHEFEQDQISFAQLERIKRDLRRLLKVHPKLTVAELSPEHIAAFCGLGKPSKKTYNNRRGILSTFLKFAYHAGWVVANPIEKVPHHRIRRKRGSAVTLTSERAEKLMRDVEKMEGGRFVPFFALCLFAGIRPSVTNGEIMRMTPELVNLEAGVINITAEVSKVREPRKITIHPNLAAWLKAYPLDKFPIVPERFTLIRAKIAKAHNLTHDVMRHTFISMFVAKFRSVGEAALQAGNSESIIRKHYLDLKSQTEAEQFYGIMPTPPQEEKGDERAAA